VKSNLLRTSTA